MHHFGKSPALRAASRALRTAWMSFARRLGLFAASSLTWLY